MSLAAVPRVGCPCCHLPPPIRRWLRTPGGRACEQQVAALLCPCGGSCGPASFRRWLMALVGAHSCDDKADPPSRLCLASNGLRRSSLYGRGKKNRAAAACAVNGDARGCRYLLGGVDMTMIGLPPRAPGETTGPACRTGQRRRLSAATFLKALPWMRVEYRM
jgi:hypothetical protein